MKKIDDARNMKDGKLFNSYVTRFRTYICNYQEEMACCCGPDQKSPSELPTLNDMSLATSGEFTLRILIQQC